MFTKVLIVSAIIAAVAMAAVEYPEGINPALCPNYPFCDMELLARYTPKALPIPEWNMYPYGGYPYARMVYAPYPIYAKAAILPTDAPADIPTEAPAEAPVDLPAIEPARYPADFDSSLCPNYPTCT